MDAFERFWTICPHRDDDPKVLAHREWDKLLREGVDPELVIAAAERRSTTIEAPKYVRHTYKWLKDREFEEQEEGRYGYSAILWSAAKAAADFMRRGATPREDRKPKPRRCDHFSDDEWRSVLRDYKAAGGRSFHWQRDHGLPPSHAATRVPLHLLHEFGYRS